MFTTPHHRPGRRHGGLRHAAHRHTTHHRAAVVATTAALTGALALAGAGAAGAAELPSSADVQSQVSGAVEDSVEYGGYVAGSVEAFFQLPADQAVYGSAAAGALALCLVLPFPDGTCVI